jgi:hypothetical protein
MEIGWSERMEDRAGDGKPKRFRKPRGSDVDLLTHGPSLPSTYALPNCTIGRTGNIKRKILVLATASPIRQRKIPLSRWIDHT